MVCPSREKSISRRMRVGELAHHPDRVVDVASRHVPLKEHRQVHQDVDVGLDQLRHPGAAHLHHDVLAGHQAGAVHLGYGGRGDGLRLKAQEALLDR